MVGNNPPGELFGGFTYTLVEISSIKYHRICLIELYTFAIQLEQTSSWHVITFSTRRYWGIKLRHLIHLKAHKEALHFHLLGLWVNSTTLLSYEMYWTRSNILPCSSIDLIPTSVYDDKAPKAAPGGARRRWAAPTFFLGGFPAPGGAKFFSPFSVI